MAVKLLQYAKQASPNEIIDEGSVMEVKLLQYPKHDHPRNFIDEGSVIEVKLIQKKYLLLVDYQYYTL